MGSQETLIKGFFVDCREHSQTFQQQVELHFHPSYARKLIIPRGVAHTFDDLEGIVTRDEPIWYVSDNNPDWDIDNDLIAVKRETPISSFPTVKVNEHLLPDEFHEFQSRLSQNLLKTPKAYLSRSKVTDGDDIRYEYDEPSWGGEEFQFAEKVRSLDQYEGVRFIPSNYALTGPRSFTIVPSTDSCISDVYFVDASSPLIENSHMLHLRTRMYLTILNNEGDPLQFSFRDLRPNSSGSNVERLVTTSCDPRLTIIIDPGIGYAFHSPKPLIVRLEQEVFADENEPRFDLPMFGQDYMILASNIPSSIPKLPTLKCPPSVIKLLAKTEINETISLTAIT
jgi:hypothetical protein